MTQFLTITVVVLASVFVLVLCSLSNRRTETKLEKLPAVVKSVKYSTMGRLRYTEYVIIFKPGTLGSFTKTVYAQSTYYITYQVGQEFKYDDSGMQITKPR